MKKLIFSTALLALIISGVFLHFRYRQTAFVAVDGFTQGTTYHIVIKQPLRTLLAGRRSVTKEEIDSLLHRFDLSLSSYLPESVISRINRNDPEVRTDTFFNVCFRASERIWRETGGAFDITVGPLVDAWGFGPEGPEPVDSAIIDSLRQLGGMEKVRLEGDRVIKSDPRIRLDVNAIAQGYSVDVVAKHLERKGIRNYLVEIGGELKARGRKGPGDPWRVGVDKPIDNNNVPGAQLQVVLQLKNRALATSGNYRKFYEKNGVKYGHEIDPHTGYPARNRLLSVTVLADECIWADGYATAFMVMGLEKSKAFVKARNDLDVYFVYSDDQGNFQTYYTRGFDKMIVR
jgi:thiamine biosynthesis lipoprotein